MRNLRQIIKEELLLEKKIGQIRASLEIAFLFDVIRTTHAHIRTTRTGIENYEKRDIGNDEINELINMSKSEIAEKIAMREIVHEQDFVIKSLRWQLALAIRAIHVDGTYWELLVKTVFRESKDNPFKVGEGQLVIYLDFR
jgi:hypothetical protein